jgi:hypothetical protein
MIRLIEMKSPRLWAAVATALVALTLSASSVFAGEITGNGTLKDVNGRSFCAYSGQEDLQWYTTDGDTTLRPNPVRGYPSHAQNWGQFSQADRDFLTSIGQNPGLSCNPNRSTFGT